MPEPPTSPSRPSSPEDPLRDEIADRSLAVLFAVSVGILLIVSSWALYDEMRVRRPWKAIQSRYREARIGELNRAIEAEWRGYETVRSSPEHHALQARIEAEEERLARPGAVAEIADLADARDAAERQSRAALARLRQLRGEYEEAEWRHGRSHAERDRRRMEELRPSVEQARDEWEEERRRGKQFADRLAALTSPLEHLRDELAAFRAKLDQLEAEVRATRATGASIRQVSLEGTSIVDRCTSCHLGMDDPHAEAIEGPLGNHPGRYLEWHPVDRFGCTLCHRGQGRAVSSVDAAHGDVKHWLQPMLRGAYVQASCQKCHLRPRELEGAPVLAEGRRILEEAGCAGCHPINGMEYLEKIGPPLANVGSKTTFEWITRWLAQPRAILPLTMMPNFELTQKEIMAIAAYLLSLSEPTAQPIEWEAFLKSSEEALTDEEFDRVEELRLRGKGVWGKARCSFCHARKGRMGGFPIGPDLGRAGPKLKRDWVYRWVRKPRAYFSTTRMPHFRLGDADLRALVEFILRDPSFLPDDSDEEPSDGEEARVPVPSDPATLARGEALVRRYGCFGCHDIPGMENEDRVGPDISDIGSKLVARLDFGRADALPRTLVAWLRAKISSPRVFREDLKMPSHDFTGEEVEALVTLLLGFVDAPAPRSLQAPPPPPVFRPAGPFGALLRDVNCLTCHRIRGTGGRIAPDLTAEGSRVKGDWLRKFLKAPDVIRPQLKQMPRFYLSDDEVEIAAGFIESALRDDRPSDEAPQDAAPAGGAKSFHEIGCHACHQIGSEGGALGPTLTTAGERLRPEFVRRYLRAPARYNNGAPEPDFGLDPAVIESLVAYIDTLRTESSR